MVEKLLTIAIPTYNRSEKLAFLIDSIIPQLNESVEVFISDNASTDGTADLVSRLNEKNSSIRFVRQTHNVGIDRNVDTAVINSLGKFVWLCGDDDQFEADSIDYILAVLKSGDFATGWVNCSRWDNELKECWAPKIIKLDHDLLGVSIGTVISVTHIKFSFLSSHIVRRDLWIAEKARANCFAPPFTDCIWMLGHLLAGVDRMNFVVSRPLLRQRSSEYDNVTLAKIPVLLNWCRVMDIAVKFGVPRSDVEPFFHVSANGPHIINSVIHKKRFAPEAAYQEFIPTILFFWKYPRFWLTAFPLLIMPGFVVRGLRRLYRFQLKVTGFKFNLRDKDI
jgi:glycosyltransferase involved in cell wall biosynthesis